MPSLAEIARQVGAGYDATAKPIPTYALYERYFPPQETPATVLELGVHTGESLRVWASYYAAGKVIGIDLASPGPDFRDYPNIVYESGNQRDGPLLSDIAARHAPDGFDLIIDDASHIGYYALLSYMALFPHLKSGGLYIIEDWGTGYFDDWPDGGHYQRIITEEVHGLVPKRIVSHDFGMVGFVKWLIDETAGDHVRPRLSSPALRADTIEFMHVNKGFVVIKKL